MSVHIENLTSNSILYHIILPGFRAGGGLGSFFLYHAGRNYPGLDPEGGVVIAHVLDGPITSSYRPTRATKHRKTTL